MTDPALRRADELLTELVELVETARALPMSSSCVLPREHLLDLLDDLRGVMPAEIAESRRIVAQRDSVLSQAREEADRIVAVVEARLDRADDEAATLLEQARQEGSAMVAAARVEAHETRVGAEQEQNRLMSATTVHQNAVESAREVRASAEEYAEQLRADAEDYAMDLREQAHAYADRTLADLGDILRRTEATAENGRASLAQRPTN
jgi:hypothetical protein